MSQAFRELLKKIGSGPHTGKSLSREEAKAATLMMLHQTATPAQIGAFMIAHRIKRPTPPELAGMLDAYDQLGPQVGAIASAQPVIVFGIPYDGRSRTAPVLPLTALILAAAGQPVLMHGGTRMPTKYGISLTELWQGLGVDWTYLSLAQVQEGLAQTRLGYVYLPEHFPLAQALVPYRDQIGKRPPFATLELLWCPYAGDAHLISGFVHPPTEINLQATLALRGTHHYTTVKGLEGSCDLPCDRTAIVGYHPPEAELQRLLLAPRDYNLGGRAVPLADEGILLHQMQQALKGQDCDLLPAVLWNGGFYLWHTGCCADLSQGIAQTMELLQSGLVLAQLAQLQQWHQTQKSLATFA
ncbi:hypothetical protein GS597_09625 [Synechococcales cyanobacterium C]|uniref:Anthranilate phosphoribosyltransferase n=1 Tax=Petrachloros mirabilis ULC683 TaxID=2781853 RepID=A0A8K1ZZ24_9CYAN|nr:anthranilate phosphoribosyltransferase family protein [Petrachloros mirabilis]NCJ06762.1 hypothetical protein [Petrachloros mirabilis ULC683]